MRLVCLSLAALLAAAPAASAKDLFQPLEDFVESIAPRENPRPAPRPAPRAVEPEEDAEDEAADDEAEEAPPPPLPRPRPEEAEAEDDAGEVEEVEVNEVAAPEAAEVDEAEPEPELEPEPEPEPDRVYQTACPALLSGVVVGEMLPPIAEGICGERSPLAVTAVRVNGREIALSSPVTTNCAMAGAFADWVAEVDAYAGAALDSPLASVTTGTSMMCRDRVGGGSAFVSEHGFANALDIVGFALADGRTVTVEADWLPATALEGRLLRQAHGAACGRFTTVLGPETNAEHEDHLHFDLGCHGQTCTAQLCE